MIRRYLAATALLLLLAACGPSINWQERVGSFTYDQAVDELGEPRTMEETMEGDTRYYWYELGSRQWNDVYVLTFSSDGVLKKVERVDD